MGEKVIITTGNLMDVEMPSVQEHTSRSVATENEDVVVPAKTVERNNQKKTKEIEKKKTAKAGQKKFGNLTKDDTNRMTVDENSNISEQSKNLSGKNRKRKVTFEEQLENGTEQDTEDDTAMVNENTENLEQMKNDIGASLKMKTAKKEQLDIAGRKTENDPDTVGRNTRNSNENKNDTAENDPRQTAVHPTISKMVMASFKSLRKRNGTSAAEITKHVEENYQVDIKKIKPQIKRFLHKGVKDGLFDQVSGSGADEKFKIKKAEKAKGIGKEKIAAKKGSKGDRKVEKAVRNVEKVKAKVKMITRKVKNDKKVRPKKKMAKQM